MRVIAKEGHLPLKVWASMAEAGALEQADNLTALPVAVHHVSLMPDTHQGFGMPIGGVLFTDGAVVPNAVGVDIGCGVALLDTGMHVADLHEKVLRDILDAIAERIPTGFRQQPRPLSFTKAMALMNTDLPEDGSVKPDWFDKQRGSLGTLGGGNHFIEVQVDPLDGKVCVMLHSGSRGLGKDIGDHYHKLALALNKTWHTKLPTDDLAFFPRGTDENGYYMNAMNFGLRYAELNRELMLEQVTEVFAQYGVEPRVLVNVHHNFAAWEHHFGRDGVVHRKGAIRARKGETLLIPGSMGTASYIGVGLGNPDSYDTCQHGAGRQKGRKQAAREWTKEDLANDMAAAGVLMAGHAADAVDEGPRAYKDIDVVMQDSADLVEPVMRLKPLGVVKG